MGTTSGSIMPAIFNDHPAIYQYILKPPEKLMRLFKGCFVPHIHSIEYYYVCSISFFQSPRF